MAAPIYVNGRALGKRDSGIARYTTEIIARLGDGVHILQPQQANSGIGGHIWEQVALARQLPKDALLWSPANSGPLRVANQLLTLHDVSMLEHPEWFAPGFAAWYWFLLPRLVKRVRKIITVSEFSRGRIVEFLGVPEEKIVVIPNGVDHEVFYPRQHAEIDSVKASYGIERDYVISVGSLQPRKNLKNLLSAWSWVNKKNPQIELIVVGIEGLVFRNRGYSEVPPAVRFLGQVPDIDLPGLYSGALACIQPSYYEGFNLPAVEAMACGVPILAASFSSAHEVIGEAGWLFDSTEVEMISDALCLALENNDFRDTYRQKGLDRAKGFSWEKATEATLAALKASQ